MDIAEEIGDKVRDKVKNVLWLDRLKEEDQILQRKFNDRVLTDDRCMVCTLPYGTCEHTQQWMEETRANLEIDSFKSALEKEIDDALNFFDDGFQIDTTPVSEDIDISGMQWNKLEQRLTDKIGASNFSLFAPDERGWHSCVRLNDKFLVVYGGFKYKKNCIPQPFKAIPNPLDIEYLSDIRVYDTENLCWHGVRDKSRGGGDSSSDSDQPAEPMGRYGHTAAALSDNRMLIHGGRGAHGKILSDTWIYHHASDTWEWVNLCERIGAPVPSPRYFSSAVHVPQSDLVYLFGGTSGVENYGDLWVFHGVADQSINSLQWERLVAVGMPPCPRYGHQCVLVSAEQIAVVGGCHVSPSGEMVGSNLSPSETKSLLELSSALQKRYKAENSLAARGGQALESNIDYSGSNFDGTGAAESMHLSDLHRQSAQLSGSLHILEQDTRVAEMRMMSSYKLSQASTAFHIHSAKHSVAQLDIVFLNLREVMWHTQISPPIRGAVPCSRIHFGAAVIGTNLFVLGGAEPTSKIYKLIDQRYTQVNILNLETMRWSCPVPTNSADSLVEPIRVAQADIIRAKKRIDEEKYRGLSLGARNGKTVELAEAEAVLSVCHWRLSVLLKEETDCTNPPEPRFGCSLTAVHQRLIYCGGWNPVAAVAQGEVLVLNLEHEHERRRRLEDEFSARLERDRIAEEAQANLMNVQSVYELRAKLFAEKVDREREWSDMAKEEARSWLPPLSKPKPVRLVKASQHTMWVKWDRIHKNSSNQIVDADTVTYMLYMQVGFQNLLVNDRVLATKGYGDGNKSPKKKKNTRFNLAPSENSLFFNEKMKRFPGEIVKLGDNGTFDVLFDDGHVEKNVPRSRLVLAPPLPPISATALQSSLLSRPNTADTASLSTSPARGNGSPPPSPSKRVRTAEETALFNLAPAVKSRIARKIQQKQSALLQLNLFRKPLTDDETILSGSKPGSRATANTLSRKLNSPKGASASAVGSAVDYKSFLGEIDSLLFENKTHFAGDFNSSNNSPQKGVQRGLGSAANSRSNSRVNSPRSVPSAVTPTVTVDPRWKLVYIGNECEYTVTGLVPLDIIAREPQISVPVCFCLQTLGLDSPAYEHSQLSEKSTFSTAKPAAIKAAPLQLARQQKQNSNVVGVVGEKPSALRLQVDVSQDNVSDEFSETLPTMSKTRKDIISAVISGQQMVQIERRNNAFLSQGVADHYL